MKTFFYLDPKKLSLLSSRAQSLLASSSVAGDVRIMGAPPAVKGHGSVSIDWGLNGSGFSIIMKKGLGVSKVPRI